MSAVRRLLLALLAACGLMLALAPTAGAHAVVVSSDPADGSRLARSPTAVTIRFDESVGLGVGYLRVVDSTGKRVDAGAATHPNSDGSAITVPLKAGLGDGSYLASYRVTSADSHPVAGTVRWVVGNGPLDTRSGPSGSAPVNGGVSTSLAISHWLSFTGVGLVGGSWLIFVLWPAGRRRSAIRRLVWAGWAAAVIGALGEFLLQGPYAAGSGFGAIFHTGLIDATLHANSGDLLSVRLVLLGILGAVLTALFGDLRRWPNWVPEAAAIVGVGVVITFAASGHSESANPRWLAVLVDALHLSAMIIWLGGLAMLLVAALTGASDTDGDPDADPDSSELSAGLPVFSRVAMVCVATLAITGTIQAWREIGTVDAITSTRYGQLVLLKVVLFVGLLGLGYLARRTLQRPVAGRTSLLRLRRTLLTEVTVGALVLAATGVLISQPPGKVALAAQRGKPRSATVAVTASSNAVVGISPGVHGQVAVSVQLSGNLHPTKVSATVSLPAKQLGPIPVSLTAAGPDAYSASGVLLPTSGLWQITLTVQTSEFDSTTAVATVRIY